MSRNRSVMKPITDLWRRCCRTTRENLCKSFLYSSSLLFSGKRLSVNLCADSHNSGEGTLYFTTYRIVLFVKKSEQMSIWFDFCELKFNTISIVLVLIFCRNKR
jgi:hypothetical protein